MRLLDFWERRFGSRIGPGIESEEFLGALVDLVEAMQGFGCLASQAKPRFLASLGMTTEKGSAKLKKEHGNGAQVLFVAQRFHGIELGGSHGRDQSADDADHEQHGG